MTSFRQGWAYGAAQARFVFGLLSAYELPLAGAAAEALAGKACVAEEQFAGSVPATVSRPGRGRGPWPAVLVFPGITRRGRAHPAFQGMGRALAASGHLAVVAEPGEVALGELHPALVDAGREVALELISRCESRGETIALAGVSGGGTLALLLAADPALASCVTGVTVLAPPCDMEQALRVGTTGTYRAGGEVRGFAAGSFAALVVARSLVASLPDGPDRDALRAELLALDDQDPAPLERLRARPRAGLNEPAKLVLELLSNEDPERFDELYAALPDAQRQAVELLSAIRVASRIEAPVEFVVGRMDKYVPFADAVAFAAAASKVRLTVIESLEHAVPKLGWRELKSLAQLDGVFVRMLAAARTERGAHTSRR